MKELNILKELLIFIDIIYIKMMNFYNKIIITGNGSMTLINYQFNKNKLF